VLYRREEHCSGTVPEQRRNLESAGVEAEDEASTARETSALCAVSEALRAGTLRA
jgi:hypothetical protein